MLGLGKLFVFEGPDGVGKSTLAQTLTKHLNATGISCDCLSFPGQLPRSLGRHIYEVHHDPKRFGLGLIDPASLQVLHVAAHIDLIERHIRPALKLSRWIVLDRFWWSTWVYGFTKGVSDDSLKAMMDLELVHWGSIRPDAVILVLRKSPIQQEGTTEDFSMIDEAYRVFVTKQANEQRIHVVHNEGTIQEALNQICVALADLLGPYIDARESE